MGKWLCCWTIMLVPLSVSICLATPTQPTDPPIVYGEANYGLKIGGWFDSQNHTIYCRIQNEHSLPIRYCDYFVGNHEFVLLYARQTQKDSWKFIPLKPDPWRAYLSAGPRERNICWLRPDRIMPEGPYGRTSALSKKSKPKYTLEVILGDFAFPSDWHGEIECKVKQIMCNPKLDDLVGDRSLETKVIKVVLPLENKQQQSD